MRNENVANWNGSIPLIELRTTNGTASDPHTMITAMLMIAKT
jgi:hypothetical protein